jgi:hypothetical protein
MGVVYRARHVELGREVALKLLSGELSSDPEFVARFQREGRLQASLDHPHVVTVYEAGESEHGVYLAMRLIEGATLAELIAEGTLDAGRALHVLGQMADALDAAHASGLVHRDVKPQNVLVGEGDESFLGDFGLTRLGGASGVTAPEKLVGTLAYLAPEVILGAEASPASDRYAFAAMAFECLTGTVVYPRPSEAAILYAHMHEPAPSISRRREALPAELDELFTGALAKEPGRRPRTAGEFVASLENTLAAAGARELGPPPPPTAVALGQTTIEPARRPGAAATPTHRRKRFALLLATGIVTAGVAALVAVAIDDGAGNNPGETIPPPLAGAVVLGSDLSAPGRAVDCKGHRLTHGASGCTVVQARLPGRTLVVPDDGVIRGWAVRSARGELALSVVRVRGNDAFQIARSQSQFVENDGLFSFKTDLQVERGDLVGLASFPGSGPGVRPGPADAVIRRWIPKPGLGDPKDQGGSELLLRADLIAGAQQQLPKQVTGSAAAQLPPGHVHGRRDVRFTDGRTVQIALVEVGHHFALDQFLGGRRTARINVPDFHPGEGQVLKFGVYSEPGLHNQLGIELQYVATDSARLIRHFYDGFPREFIFVN